MKKDSNIKYLVIINDSKFDLQDQLWYQTTCSSCFCGYLINSNCNQSIFELNTPSKALVIVPTDKIKWMAPIKEKKEEK